MRWVIRAAPGTSTLWELVNYFGTLVEDSVRSQYSSARGQATLQSPGCTVSTLCTHILVGYYLLRGEWSLLQVHQRVPSTSSMDCHVPAAKFLRKHSVPFQNGPHPRFTEKPPPRAESWHKLSETPTLATTQSVFLQMLSHPSNRNS